MTNISSYGLDSIHSKKILPASEILSERFSSLIFDLDGTILDSMSAWGDVDKVFLEAKGHKVTKDYTDFVKNTDVWTAAEYTKNRYHINMPVQEIIDSWDQLISQAYSSTIMAKPGVASFIANCKRLGMRIACATALSRKNAEAGLLNNELLHFFDDVVTLDDIGHKIDKSSPEIFLESMDRLGENCQEKCLVFEDLMNALQTASSSGFSTCAVYDSINDFEWESSVNLASFFVKDWKYCK